MGSVVVGRSVVVRGDVEAPLDAVVAVLADPSSYDRLAEDIRAVRWFDAGWPATGSRFHHTVGLGPLAVRDQAEVLAGELPDRLELAVGLGPAGALRVELRLRASASASASVSASASEPGLGTWVELTASPRSGPLSRWWTGPVERITRQRTAGALRRLDALAAERARVQSLDGNVPP